MNVDYISKEETKVISSKVTYPKGANSPTYVTTYKCFCGKGKLIEERVAGFNDHFAYLKCRRCSKKYSYVDFAGSDWEVTLK